MLCVAALTAFAVPSVCLGALGTTIAQGAPRNGGFESGDFAGWLTNSNGGGIWDVYTGPGAWGLAPPPQEEFAAQTIQKDPSSSVLYRDLRLKRNVKYELTMLVYYVNTAGAFVTPDSLSLHFGVPNQQYRIDLIKPTSPLRSLKPKHVLMNIFRTQVGDPLTMTPNLITANLSRFDGRTVRLRVAEADSEYFFAAGIDAVALTRSGQPARSMKASSGRER
jgi:hypothetical protein